MYTSGAILGGGFSGCTTTLRVEENDFLKVDNYNTKIYLLIVILVLSFITSVTRRIGTHKITVPNTKSSMSAAAQDKFSKLTQQEQTLSVKMLQRFHLISKLVCSVQSMSTTFNLVPIFNYA